MVAPAPCPLPVRPCAVTTCPRPWALCSPPPPTPGPAQGTAGPGLPTRPLCVGPPCPRGRCGPLRRAGDGRPCPGPGPCPQVEGAREGGQCHPGRGGGCGVGRGPPGPLRALGTLSPAGHLPGVLVPAPRAPTVGSCLRLGWRQESHTARVRQSGAAGIRPLSYYLKRASGGFLEGASGPSCSLTASSARVDTAPKGPGRFTGRPQAPVDLPVPLGGGASRETPSQMRFSSSMRPGSGAGIRITGISGACSVFAQRATLRRPVPSGRACPRPPAASTPWPRADAISLGGLQIAPGRGLQRVQLSLGFIF